MSLGNGEYARKLDQFLAQKGLSGSLSPVDIYHAVRNIPYSSRGERDPELVLINNEGSCSGKHILLRDLLRHINQEATVETVQGDFAASVPVVESMPDNLQHYCRHGGIKDFHQYVVWQSPEGECKLDATWPDYLVTLGFSDNAGWTGRGNTKLALEPEVLLDRVEDVPAYKEILLEGLADDERTNRLNFLTLLSDWLVAIETRGDTK
jgi:hypothetical protein